MCVVTSVQPVTLFGTEIKGLHRVQSGEATVALVSTTGPKARVVSVGARHGGKLSDVGLDSRRLRKFVG